MIREISAAIALTAYSVLTPAYWPITTSRALKFLSAKKATRTNTSSILVDAKTTMARPIRVTSDSIRSECATGILDPEGRTESFSRATDGILPLHRRTFYRTVRAKDAAVARLRTQQRLTVRAFVEELACVGRHCFALRETANRAHEQRFKKNFAHTRFSCGLRRDSPPPQSLWLAQQDSLYQDQTKYWRFSYRNPLSRP